MLASGSLGPPQLPQIVAIFLTQTMASADDFTHQLAIKLSRILNIVNPNDLLARTVIELAKTHPPEGFAKGAFLGSLNLLGLGFWV
jgi:hypothetical protein